MGFEPSEVSPQAAPARSGLSLAHAVAAVFAAFVLAQLFGMMAADIASSLGFTGAAAKVTSTGHTPAIVVASMIGSELALLLVAMLVPLIAALPWRETLGLRGASPQVILAASVGTVMLGPVGDFLMTHFAERFPDWSLGAVPALNELAKSLPVYVIWPAFALLPGVAEELVFRGVLQNAAGRTLRAVVFSGVAFALFHVDPVHVVGVLPLGLFLSWVAQRSSTLVTLIAHVVNNSVAVLTIRSTTLDVGYGAARELPISWLLASVVVVALAAFVISRATQRTR